MRWLIDGYNVIRRDPDLRAREAEGLAAGRAGLLRLVGRAARGSGDAFTVVFDGARPGGGAPAGGQVEAVFSRPPERADDLLVRLAARWRDGAVVVTSDRTVRDAARRAGCAVLTADEFLDAAAGGAPEGGGEALEEDDAETPSRRGNPRRPSRQARAAQRARRRLGGG